jgi:hypothetical protein
MRRFSAVLLYTAPAVLLILCSLLAAGCEDATFYIEGSDGGDGLPDAADMPAEAPGDGLPDPFSDTPDLPADPCEGVTCSGQGTCTAAGGSPECLCNEGFVPSGLACEPDPCAAVECGAFAHCDAGSCLCDDGYEGDPYAGCTAIPTTEDDVRAQLVEIAMAELGLCEGVDDRPYMLDQPGYWCYDFVAWVYDQVDYPLPTPLSLPEYYVGSLPTGWRPEPGDMIKFTIQHYGMVADVSADGLQITTIEGNYNFCVHSRPITDASVEYYGSLDYVFE